MKTVMNCAKPVLFSGKKNEVKPEVKTEVKAPVQPSVDAKVEVKPEVKPQLQPQLKADTVELSTKAPKCEGDACKK